MQIPLAIQFLSIPMRFRTWDAAPRIPDEVTGMLKTTGRVALELHKSREGVVADLRTIGLEPLRDSVGRRLLTDDDVRKLEELQRRRRRRFSRS